MSDALARLSELLDEASLGPWRWKDDSPIGSISFDAKWGADFDSLVGAMGDRILAGVAYNDNTAGVLVTSEAAATVVRLAPVLREAIALARGAREAAKALEDEARSEYEGRRGIPPDNHLMRAAAALRAVTERFEAAVAAGLGEQNG